MAQVNMSLRIDAELKDAFRGPLGKRIYGHSRFCNTDFDDKWACLNLSGV